MGESQEGTALVKGEESVYEDGKVLLPEQDPCKGSGGDALAAVPTLERG